MAHSKAVIEIKGRKVRRVLIWKRNKSGELVWKVSNPNALKRNNTLNMTVAYYTAIGVPVIYYDIDKKEFIKSNYTQTW
jgi:hypothetical protein